VTAPPLPPLPARHRLAGAILAALHDPAARRLLSGLARDDAAVRAWLGADAADAHDAVKVRAGQASATVAAAPLGPPSAALSRALEDAALLFDAGLFFEAHEVLEPHWREAAGPTREALQGLIQIAVGYQHRVNGNGRGARALLAEGVARVRGRSLLGISLGAFAAAVAATIEWPTRAAAGLPPVPPFPRDHAPGPGGPAPS
jgi:hypothetical protein